VRAVQAAALVRAEAPTAELHIRRHVVPGYDPEQDAGYYDLVRDLTGAAEHVAA
jgi:hypothetical protein